ncbi:aminodeoxychorismate/anthranilate synthase component II [uncultured Microscilla sp.]|uniref:anthranilate synthase component II n=1 Tax=uncultured Microscilla sp. TaxID=432653 RepID=UPI00261E2BD8|nr:aminodeoxychorismate/anthranilate synthase component II [uncultured Microscilla sp.]
MKVLVIDNYDSFVYNLVHMIRDLGHQPEVYRNDKIELDTVAQYDKILLSPGPGIPEEAGILLDLIKTYAPTKSILGVCLGHQAIAEAFGAELLNLPTVLHGIASANQIQDPSEALFKGLPMSFSIGHYHSWVIKEGTLPAELVVTGKDTEGNVMSISHAQYDVKGLQFHPESILTDHGIQILANWLNTPAPENYTLIKKKLVNSL